MKIWEFQGEVDLSLPCPKHRSWCLIKRSKKKQVMGEKEKVQVSSASVNWFPKKILEIGIP